MNNTDNTQALLWQPTTSARTLIAFGGIRLGMGMPTFEFFRSLESLKVNKLFIRDFAQAWYQKGAGNYNDIPALSRHLSRLRTESAKCLMIGNSMGGFAAILFGALVNADTVLAFAPQTFVDHAQRETHQDKRWRSEIPALHSDLGMDGEYYDLLPVLAGLEYNTVIHLFYDPAHRLDCIHAERMKAAKGVYLHPEKGGHGIIKKIRDDGRLLGMVKKYLK